MQPTESTFKTNLLPITFLGTGAYVPERVVTNEHFAGHLDTSDEWIRARTGIRERRYAAGDETTSVLATNACERALADANLTIDDIDIIICATATGDQPFPATAVHIQAALGGKDLPSFDVSAACSGFLHAAIVAAGLLSSGIYNRALVVGAETLSRWIDPEDRRTVILFGDGAGAAVLGVSKKPDQGILYCDLGCDGTKSDLICIPAGGSTLPSSNTTVAERLHYMHMKGREVYKFAVNKMQRLIDNALEQAGLTPDALSLVIPHQSNLRIIESVREKMGLPREKVTVHIDRYGNTSAASVPMGLDEARRNGTVKEGDCVLMVAIGAGLTWATLVVRL